MERFEQRSDKMIIFREVPRVLTEEKVLRVGQVGGMEISCD